MHQTLLMSVQSVALASVQSLQPEAAFSLHVIQLGMVDKKKLMHVIQLGIVDKKKSMHVIQLGIVDKKKLMNLHAFITSDR